MFLIMILIKIKKKKMNDDKRGYNKIANLNLNLIMK